MFKVLFASGAHMPLVFFVGDRARRTANALEQRELKAERRGWGPSSANRSKSLEAQAAKGKGKGGKQGKAEGKSGEKGQDV